MSITKVRYNQMAPVPEQDDTAVDLTSTQTITGRKTFANGQVNLSPESATANHGGKIAFHYNQNSSATSSIAENASGQIKITGDLYLNGKINSAVKINGSHSTVSTPGILITGGLQNHAIQLQNTGMTKGTAPESNIHTAIDIYGSTDITNYNQRLGCLEHRLTSNNESCMILRAYKTSAVNDNGSCEIYCIADADGNAYTKAPTPITTDNSTKIATTAYVKNNLASYAALASPALTGTPTAPTAAATTNNTQIATTAFVNNRLPYTTGTWTPVLYGSSVAGELTYSTNTAGTYKKIGKMVYVDAYIKVTGITTQPTGKVYMSGLPFTRKDYIVNINIWATGGVSNSFSKVTTGYCNAYNNTICFHGNSATDMGKVSHLTWSTSSVAGYNVQLAASNGTVTAAEIFLSGWYSSD